MKRCLIIFAKEPALGRVKTRLRGYLTPQDCVSLYQAFLRDTAKLASNIRCEKKVLAYDPGKRSCPFLGKIFKGYTFYRQRGRDLGARMSDAFKAFTKNGYAVVITGSDTPHLPAQIIDQAFTQLEKNDVVLGPCRDGGFYLIGLKRFCPELFKSVTWSSPKVLSQTMRNAKAIKSSVKLLQPWYDIDTPEDLNKLKKFLRRNNRPPASQC